MNRKLLILITSPNSYQPFKAFSSNCETLSKLIKVVSLFLISFSIFQITAAMCNFAQQQQQQKMISFPLFISIQFTIRLLHQADFILERKKAFTLNFSLKGSRLASWQNRSVSALNCVTPWLATVKTVMKLRGRLFL